MTSAISPGSSPWSTYASPLTFPISPLDATALDFLLKPELIADAWKYFREVQPKYIKYQPLIADTDQPAIELIAEKMAKYREQMRKFYYDTARFPTYLDQLGITYPTLKK